MCSADNQSKLTRSFRYITYLDNHAVRTEPIYFTYLNYIEAKGKIDSMIVL